MRAFAAQCICAVLAVLGSGASFADGPGAFKRAPGLPEAAAKALETYNAGVKEIERADRQGPQQAATAAQGYEAALARFEEAARIEPVMYEAHTYIGYANRKLGRYEAALQAYGAALRLKADFAPAIEYQGEAYLGLDRLEEAKVNFYRLYATAPDQAAKLLAAMQAWVVRRRQDPGRTGAATVEDMAAWVAGHAVPASGADSPAGTATGW